MVVDELGECKECESPVIHIIYLFWPFLLEILVALIFNRDRALYRSEIFEPFLCEGEGIFPSGRGYLFRVSKLAVCVSASKPE